MGISSPNDGLRKVFASNQTATGATVGINGMSSSTAASIASNTAVISIARERGLRLYPIAVASSGQTGTIRVYRQEPIYGTNSSSHPDRVVGWNREFVCSVACTFKAANLTFLGDSVSYSTAHTCTLTSGTTSTTPDSPWQLLTSGYLGGASVPFVVSHASASKVTDAQIVIPEMLDGWEAVIEAYVGTATSINCLYATNR